MEQQKFMKVEYFDGMTIIGSKKERIAKMISNINKVDLNDIITIPETREEIKALNPYFVNYDKEQLTETVFTTMAGIIKIINEINLDLNKHLTRDAEDMRAETMPEIIWALDKLATSPTKFWMAEVFPFLNTSEKAGDFMVYVWEFFQNAREIMERLYDNRSLKVTEYKKTGYIAKYNWQKFTDARETTKEIVTIANETAKKLYEARTAAEELK